jgi:hypothetical protein
MTLVERHFDFGGFLCLEDVAEKIAIEDEIGAGGRRGEERREKMMNKKRSKNYGGERRGEEERAREGRNSTVWTG